MLMENFLRSKEYWNLVDSKIPQSIDDDTEKKIIEELKLKYLKVKTIYFKLLIELSLK